MLPAASSKKLADNSSGVNRRARKSGAPSRKIVAELNHRRAENRGGMFRPGGRDGDWRSFGEIVAEVILRCAEDSRGYHRDAG